MSVWPAGSLAVVFVGEELSNALTLPSCRVSGAGTLEVYSHNSSIGEGPTGPDCGFTCTDLLAMVNL
jgi:hypothetical protein